MRPCSVYIGGFQPSPDLLFLKAGMTNDVAARMKAYAGMIPGGLTFMYATELGSRGEALNGERGVLTALAATEGIEAVGGEWFKCAPLMKLTALDELWKVGKQVLQVRTLTPEPYAGNRRGRRKKGSRK
ncbi:hypothetical protein SAMN05216569_1081 [Pseudoxanthomonas sp. CF125]|nr:hypothetical protein SAMN05216569_1081 [Pseudoxanthomonas sp. CF125]